MDRAGPERATRVRRQELWLTTWRGPDPLRFEARPVVWVAAGVLLATGVVLRDLSALLGSIENGGGRSYSASVFTGPSLSPGQAVADLRAALTLWTKAAAESPTGSAARWASWVVEHLTLDLFLFVPAYVLLLFLGMGAVGVGKSWARFLALVVLLADVVETGYTVLAVALYDRSPALLAVVPWLSALKWLVVAIVVVTIVVCWLSPELDGPISARRTAARLARVRTGVQEPGPAVSLRGPLVVVAVFLAVVALPLGGPLEQLPDVLRAQLTGAFSLGEWGPLLASSVVLLLFTGSVLVAGQWSTPPEHKGGRAPRTPAVLGVAVLLGAAVVVANLLAGSPNGAVGLALPLVVGVLALADLLRTRALRAPANEVVEDVDRPAEGGVAPGTTTWTRWVNALPGLVVVGGGMGLVRACTRPLALGLSWAWLSGVVLGFLLAALGGVTVQWLLERIAPTRVAAAVRVVVPVVVGLAAVVLAVAPSLAVHIGTSGALALGLSAVTLLLGFGHGMSVRRAPWPVTQSLGLGGRTPWVGIAVTTWLVAGVLNTAGGYHDARLADTPPAPRYASLTQAWTTWLAAATANPRCRLPDGHIPLVLVAAPGGGIRATYWAASALDALVPPGDACGRTKIFALSSVSGGSIGAVTWLQAGAGAARDDAAVLARDDALAGAAAALFLRDLPQPLVGLSADWRWRDRAAVMEDAWSSELPAVLDGPWSALGGTSAAWTPATVLNSSSAADGCRILVTDVAGLPADATDCHATADSAAAGPLSGTLDATGGLAAGLGNDGDTCTSRPKDLRLVTGALLSARFPVVSPSGVFERCTAGRVQTSYGVDGGYFENTGLLTVLQTWAALEPLVRTHNETSKDFIIDPWIVDVDNHYRSAISQPPLTRQRELLVPVAALLHSREVLGQENLEQAAALATDPSRTGFGGGGFLRLAPTNGPTIQAPLGWVLSVTSRGNLDDELCAAVRTRDAVASGLLPAGAPAYCR